MPNEEGKKVSTDSGDQVPPTPREVIRAETEWGIRRGHPNTGSLQEDLEDFAKEGRQIVKAHDACQWQLGDIALQVSVQYGDNSLMVFADMIETSFNTLRQYRQVAHAYKNDDRSSNLTWSHHMRIADRSDRLQWLRQAEKEQWSIRELMAAIEEHKSGEAELLRLKYMGNLSPEDRESITQEAVIMGAENGERLYEKGAQPGIPVMESVTETSYEIPIPELASPLVTMETKGLWFRDAIFALPGYEDEDIIALVGAAIVCSPPLEPGHIYKAIGLLERGV